MTKEEALAAWDLASKMLEEVKLRHKRELKRAKAEFNAARDRFIEASSVNQQFGKTDETNV